MRAREGPSASARLSVSEARRAGVLIAPGGQPGETTPRRSHVIRPGGPTSRRAVVVGRPQRRPTALASRSGGASAPSRVAPRVRTITPRSGSDSCHDSFRRHAVYPGLAPWALKTPALRAWVSGGKRDVVSVLRGPGRSVRAAAQGWRPFADPEGSMTVWGTSPWEQRREFRAESRALLGLAFSPSGDSATVRLCMSPPCGATGRSGRDWPRRSIRSRGHTHGRDVETSPREPRVLGNTEGISRSSRHSPPGRPYPSFTSFTSFPPCGYFLIL
jgi:hypothetical protein